MYISKQSYGSQFGPWKQSYGSQFGPWLEQLIYPFFLSSFIQSATKLLSSTSIISIIGMDIIHYNEEQQHLCISWTIIMSFTVHLVKQPISRRIITFLYISNSTYGIINILTCMDGFTRNNTYAFCLFAWQNVHQMNQSNRRNWGAFQTKTKNWS